MHGYEPTREAAMAAFARSWRREAITKTTAPLTAQERVILFCTATGVSLACRCWHHHARNAVHVRRGRSRRSSARAATRVRARHAIAATHFVSRRTGGAELRLQQVALGTSRGRGQHKAEHDGGELYTTSARRFLPPRD